MDAERWKMLRTDPSGKQRSLAKSSLSRQDATKCVHDIYLLRKRTVRDYQTALSSMMRMAAGLAGFFVLSQILEGPERYPRSFRLETMPSSFSLHAFPYVRRQRAVKQRSSRRNWRAP